MPVPVLSLGVLSLDLALESVRVLCLSVSKVSGVSITITVTGELCTELNSTPLQSSVLNSVLIEIYLYFLVIFLLFSFGVLVRAFPIGQSAPELQVPNRQLRGRNQPSVCQFVFAVSMVTDDLLLQWVSNCPCPELQIELWGKRGQTREKRAPQKTKKQTTKVWRFSQVWDSSLVLDKS